MTAADPALGVSAEGRDYSHLQEIVFAHPDGAPHRKACPECAFRRSNPQQLADDDFDWMCLQREVGGFTFYCVHRQEDGYSRGCACWRAIEAGRARDAQRDRTTGAQDGTA